MNFSSIFNKLKSYSFAFLILISVAGTTVTTDSSHAAATVRCAELLSSAGARDKIPSFTVETNNTRSLEKAEQYLSGVVKSGQPFKFDQAIEYVLLSLPEGRIKDEFVISLQRNILDNDISVSDRTGLRTLLGANRVEYYSRLLHPLRDSRQMGKKVIWNAKKVNSPNEALSKVFDAIRVVLEPEFRPIRGLSVYFGGRGSYIKEFLDSAQKLFTFQYEVYKATQEFAEVTVPNESRAKALFKNLKNIFSNFLWLKQYRTIRDLKLSQDIVDSIETQDPVAINALLRKRYGAEISVHWYLRHLRNVQNAAIVSLAVVLLPPMANAVQHQYYLETIQTSQIDVTSLKMATDIITGTNTETVNLIRSSIQHSPQNGLQPSEVQFLNEINDVLMSSSQDKPLP